jgi:lysophospholipase L1-like esterase
MPAARTAALCLLTLTASLLGLSATPAADDSACSLTKGDRIVFLGDSITQQGGGPRGYVTLIRKDLEEKHPDLNVEVINAGVSGNKVPDLQARLDKDVLEKQPTVVVIYIGINDVWHGEKDPARGTPADKYEEGLKDIIRRCQDAGARVVLCTPSVIGEKKDDGNPLDAKLDQYAGISRAVAKATGAHVCDLREAFLTYLKEHNPEDRERGVLTGDRVHLNDAGNRFVADTILKCLGE